MNYELNSPTGDNSIWKPIYRNKYQEGSIIGPDLPDYLATQILKSLDGKYHHLEYAIGELITKYSNELDDDLTSRHSILLDIFKSWYNAERRIKRLPTHLYWLHHFITSMDNHLLRMITQERTGFSYLATSIVLEKLDRAFKSDPDLKDKLDDLCKAIEAGEDPSSTEAGVKLDKVAASANNKMRKDLSKAEEMGIGKGVDPESIQMVETMFNSRLLKNVKLNRRDLDKFVKHIASKAQDSLGGRAEIVEESILESDIVDNLEHIENFSHLALIDNVSNLSKRYYMNFDLYIDCSGSMGSQASYENNAFSGVTLRALSRLFVHQLITMNMVKKMYLFSNNVHELSKKELFTKTLDRGTNIKSCINQAKANNKASIILTDGYDHIDADEDYFKKVYFVVLQQDRLGEAFVKYHRGGQILFWEDGKFYPSRLSAEQGYNGNMYYDVVSKKRYDSMNKGR